MRKLNRTAVINSGIEGLLYAGAVTAITAFISWHLISSAEPFESVGSGTAHEEVAVVNPDPG